ncbi:hypothetical protein ABZ572_02020 [Streptomyces sp. NPDC018338]
MQRAPDLSHGTAPVRAVVRRNLDTWRSRVRPRLRRRERSLP